MNTDDPTQPVLGPTSPSSDVAMTDSAFARMLGAGQTTPKKPVWTPPAPEELQKHLADYEVQALIGHGGMGAVYRGVQRSLERMVAIKILPQEMGRSDPQFAARFRLEARAMARLSHPHIVPVHDSGETADGLLYFVMEFVDGTDLHQIIRSEGHFSPKKAAAIISQVCDALEFAHENGVVHRDIKPSNIMLDRRGQVKVADFGLAKAVQAGSRVITAATLSGDVLGTLAYMAPEQAKGRQVDHRADIYSLGAMFYEMLTGEAPHGAIEPPSQRIHLDVRLDKVVLKALAHDPDRRYQRASALKTDIHQATQQVPRSSGKVGWALLVVCLCLLGLSAMRHLSPRLAARQEKPAVIAKPTPVEKPVPQDPRIARQIADMLLERGSWITIREEGQSGMTLVRELSKLPLGAFRIEIIQLVSNPSKPVTFSETELLRIAALPGLRSLSIHGNGGTKYSVAFFATMAANTSLTEIAFPDSGATDEHLAPFASRSNMTNLILSNTSISSSGLVSNLSASAESIRALGIGGRNLDINKDGEAILKAFPNIDRLRTYGDYRVEAIHELHALRFLEDIVFQKSHLTAEHQKAIVSLRETCPLQQLVLVDCTLSKSAWANLEEMTFLNFFMVQAMELPPEGMASISRLPRLKELVLSGIKPTLTPEQLSELKVALPQCVIRVE